jgi:hypothetical protein
MFSLSVWNRIKTSYYTYTISCSEFLLLIPIECRMVDLPTDEEDETHHSSESKEDQTSSSDSSSSLEEKEFSSIGW